jgi:hypothetical protein
MGTPKARRRKRLRRIEALANKEDHNSEVPSAVEEQEETNVTTRPPSALKMIPESSKIDENTEIVNETVESPEVPKPKPKATKPKTTTQRSTRTRKTPQRKKKTTKTTTST